MAARLFELPWMGGAATHFYRRARPAADALPWGTLDPSRYAPDLLEFVRRAWTEVSLNEYRAVASFAELVRCMAEAMAPLDLLGMASDFIADQVLHCELAARVAMDLGGAAPLHVDTKRFAIKADPSTWASASRVPSCTASPVAASASSTCTSSAGWSPRACSGSPSKKVAQELLLLLTKHGVTISAEARAALFA